jgi:hypothetical protein
MQLERAGTHPIELTSEIAFPGDIRFDPERVILQGVYRDQLSAYRARRIWAEALASNFLLDPGHDYEISVQSDLKQGRFLLNCSFTSACGRYAFWRLTNEQAPEAQYLIETAHIPNSEFCADSFFSAPDLKPMVEGNSDGNDFAAIDGIAKSASRVQDVLKSFRAWLYK